MGVMNMLGLGRTGLVLAAAAAATLAGASASAQTAIKFSLDFKFEGPAAPFVVAIDKGYFKAEGLDDDRHRGRLARLINRVASGTTTWVDINSLISFATPTGHPDQGVFMVYNAAARSSAAGRTSPRIWRARSPVAMPTAQEDLHPGERHRRLQGHDRNVGFRARADAGGRPGDAITGFSFSSFINLKDRGVPVDDIAVLLMADHGVNLTATSSS